MKIMFVCHGNICRSPIAEFVMKKLLADNKIDGVECSSSAVSSEEEGNDIYPDAKRIMRAKGIPFTYHRAHRITDDEFEGSDFIYVMDRSNYRALERRFKTLAKVHMLLDRDVDDPWYSGDFNAAYQDIYQGCAKIIQEATKNYDTDYLLH